MAGKLIISLDFELMWGVRDHRSVADYGDAVLGVRQVVPETLARFKSYGIRATWATVGLLFCKTRDEMKAFAPDKKPTHRDPSASSYFALDHEVGRDEDDDPYHFGRSMLDMVAETDGQEIGTHTYAHYTCLEEGHSDESFDADLKSALAVAEEAGHRLTSIVFPRNQFGDNHLAICRANGITCFRGNPGGFAYRPRDGKSNSLAVRAVRLLDGILPVTGSKAHAGLSQVAGATDATASRFLRPWMAKAPPYSALHIAQVRREMRAAARKGEIYHLWWHPHNMGRHMDRNLAQLDDVLTEFRNLQDKYGFESAHMRDLDTAA